MTAKALAKQHIKAEIQAERCRETWDQFNATVSHVFTRQSEALNRQLNIN